MNIEDTNVISGTGYLRRQGVDSFLEINKPNSSPIFKVTFHNRQSCLSCKAVSLVLFKGIFHSGW
jgi:hypothetical protein